MLPRLLPTRSSWLAALAGLSCGCSLQSAGELGFIQPEDGGLEVDASAEPQPEPPCMTDDECAKRHQVIVQSGCAEWKCEKPSASCVLTARDLDGDGYRAARCEDAGAEVKAGDDCDDGDATIHPGAWDGPAAHPVPFGITLPGWTASYFASPELSPPASAVRSDVAIDFDWQQGTPDPAIGPGPFGARWESSVVAPQTGAYTFHVSSDDGARLWVGGVPVLDLWASIGPISSAGTAMLQGNTPTAIRLEYFNQTGAASIRLEWESPSIQRTVLRVQSKPADGEQQDRCDGVDQDCSTVVDDGEVNDGATLRTCGSCEAGKTRPCGSSTKSPCHPGVETCLVSGQWGSCAGERLPEPEACDLLDNDCDGTLDEDFEVGATCTNGIGACAREGVRVCAGLDSAQCNAVPGLPDENFHAAVAPNGSWDWNCDGAVTPWLLGFLDAAWCPKLPAFCAALTTAALCNQGNASNVGTFVFPCFGSPTCGTKIAMQQCYWYSTGCYPYYTDVTNYSQACK